MIGNLIRREFLLWFGVVGTALSLIGLISPLITLSNWLRTLVEAFHRWTHEIWSFVFSIFQIHIPMELVRFLNLAAFILVTSISSSFYKKTYIVDKVEYFYDLFKGHIVRHEEKIDQASDYEYGFCYLMNAIICIVVFRELFSEIVGCALYFCGTAMIVVLACCALVVLFYIPMVGFVFEPNIKVYASRLARSTAIVLIFIAANYISVFGSAIASVFG